MTNRQEDEVPTTTLPDLDAMRAQFQSDSSETLSPTPKPGRGFRKGAAAASEAEKPAERPQSRQARPNAYAGDCTLCGQRVEAQQGLLGDRVDGKWTVTHAGDCPPIPEVVAEPQGEAAADAVFGNGTLFDDEGSEGGDKPVPVDPRNPNPGVYTVEDDEGHVTLRIHQQQMDDDFMPGVLLIEHLVGRNNEDDYARFGAIKGGRLQVWRKHQSDPERRYVRAARVVMAEMEAGTLYDEDNERVLVAKHCFRCNALLSNPVSNRAGIGPWCAKKWSW